MATEFFPISDHTFFAFLKCEHKTWLYSQNKVGQLSDFEQLENELQKAHKTKVIQKLSENFTPNEILHAPENFSKVYQNQHRFITDLKITDDKYTLYLDGLEIEEKSVGKSIRYEYTPLLFIHREKLKTEDKLLLAFQGFVFSHITNKKKKEGKIIYGKNGRSQKVKFETWIPKVKKALKELKTFEENPPEVSLNDHCRICEFRDECEKIAKEKDHLSLLRGMSEKEIKKWNQKGIFTVTQLSYNFRPRRRPKRAKNKYDRHYHELKALAIRENKIYIFENPELPESKVEIFLDVEGVPDEDLYYLIGLVVNDRKQSKEYSLWADRKSDEEKIFREFLDIIRLYEDFTVFHYGSYETKFLKKVRKVCDDEADLVEKIMERSCNVLSFVYLHVYFPVYSNGLKDVGKYLGFEWSEEEASGIQSLVWRKRWEMGGGDDLRERLVRYNLEDCLGLRRLWEVVCGVYGELDGKGDFKVEEAKNVKEKSSFRLGKANFIFDDLDYINKCAYFDYQREKIFVRTNNKNLKKKRKIKNTSLQINKQIIIRAKQCPYCKHREINKDSKCSKIIFDLKFFKSGVKKWIIKYRSYNYKCKKCKIVSRPLQFKNKFKYGHNLKSWVSYQYIALRQSIDKIVENLYDTFNIFIHTSTCSNLKMEIAHFYEFTYRKLIIKCIKSKFIHVDETTVKIGNDKAYVWIFTTMEEVIYIFRPNREGDFLKLFLKGFKGVLLSDFYAAYDSLDCEQQKCLVHLIRDLNSDLIKNTFDQEYKYMVQKFTVLLRKIIDTIDKYGLKKYHLHKHKKDVQKFFKFIFSQKYTTEVAQHYQKRFKKNKNKLFTFLDHDGVPWNNNNAEHAIKHFATQRRIFGGCMNKNSIKKYLILLSIYMTCKYKNISFLQFLLSGKKDIDKYIESMGRKKR